MKAFQFAYDAPGERSVEQIIQWVPAHDGAISWALVDAAIVDCEKLQRLAGRHEWRIRSALALSPLAAFGEQAPQLIELPTDGHALQKTMTTLLRFAGCAPAISWVCGVSSAQALQHIFAYLAKVHIEDGKTPIHCRFADLRVLPSLLAALSSPQRARLAAAIGEWRWFGRSGEPVSWRADNVAATSVIAMDDRPNLRLSIAQFRTMQHHAEADGIFKLLLDKTPEVVPDTGHGAFHEKIQGYLQTADMLQIADRLDRLQFVVLSSTCKDEFYQHPALASTWPSIAAGDARLSDCMTTWSDDVWAAIELQHDAVANDA